MDHEFFGQNISHYDDSDYDYQTFNDFNDYDSSSPNFYSRYGPSYHAYDNRQNYYNEYDCYMQKKPGKG